MLETILKAIKNKYRFTSTVSNTELTMENLWDLPLSSKDPKKITLDNIGMKLYTEINNAPVFSLVNASKSEASIETQEKFAIVKYVIEQKQAENSAKETEKRRKELLDQQKTVAASVLLDKQKQKIASMSEEELEKILFS